MGKAAKNGDWLAVYSDTTVAQVKKYLKSPDVKYKKILTTPEGFKKVRKAADKSYSLIQETYFCLFDECEKLTQDCDYRASIYSQSTIFSTLKRKHLYLQLHWKCHTLAFEGQGLRSWKLFLQ